MRLTLTAALPISRTLCTATAIALGCQALLSAQGTTADWIHPDGTTHSYLAVSVPGGITWQDANLAAARAGGYLATANSDAENALIHGLLSASSFWLKNGSTYDGPWLGGVQDPIGPEPAGGWGWANLEPLGYANWTSGQPDDAAAADRIHFGGAATLPATTWADAPASAAMPGYVIEFSGALARRTVGLQRHELGAFAGYTLVYPGTSTQTYLVDNRGRVVHTWSSAYVPGQSCYLLPNGNLLRTGNAGNPNSPGGGSGGVVEEFDWDGKLVWRYIHSGTDFVLHHDIERLPNGNTLMLVWVRKTKDESLAVGRDPAKMSQGEVWPDIVIEVKPVGTNNGTIVWQWSPWDHLIQDFDSTRPNYGSPAAHPERVDINYAPATIGDWMHSNSIAYNAKLDQIMISVRSFQEVWIIDHSTTTAEAASSSGGRSGKGGDLLFRLGNPAAHGAAGPVTLFYQHDCQWIADGLPGAGNMLVFNNGLGRPGGSASSADEIVLPPVDGQGNYPAPGGPVNFAWTYMDPNPTSFYSGFVGGAQRLANGNTLICAGWHGQTREVDRAGNTVWEYQNPIRNGLQTHQGTLPEDLATYTFRTLKYAPDYPAFTNRKLHPGAPIELHSPALLVEGSTVRAYAGIGTGVTFTLRAGPRPGSQYFVGTSGSTGLVPVDHRFVALGIDPLLEMSVLGLAPSIFRDYAGKLDANGNATATLAIPALPVLAGLKLHTAFIVEGVAGSVGTISNTVEVEITM